MRREERKVVSRPEKKEVIHNGDFIMRSVVIVAKYALAAAVVCSPVIIKRYS